jgi:hypothetical protein
LATATVLGSRESPQAEEEQATMIRAGVLMLLALSLFSTGCVSDWRDHMDKFNDCLAGR